MEEQELIAKLLRREPLACRQLVQSHHGRLVSVARAIVGEAAEDIVQEAWLLAFKSLPKFEGRSSLKTWLTRIVINAAYSRCRYDKTRFALSLDEVMDEATPLSERFSDNGHWHHPLLNWTVDTPDEILGRQQLALFCKKQLIICQKLNV
jgi:RNA polymerase sigma-70 factor (ECF subfamily)